MQTFFDVMDTLVDTNKKLINKEISLETAKQVAINTQVFLNGAKVMLEAMKLAGIKSSSFFFTEDMMEIDGKAVSIDDVEFSTIPEKQQIERIVEPTETNRIKSKQLTAPILKGMYRITIEESERFLKWLERHAIFDLADLNNSDDLKYQKWVDEGKK